ncbi:MAG: septum formation family protein [Acidimicrobiales bacterium]
MRRRFLLPLIGLCLLGAACTGDGGENADEPAPAIVALPTSQDLQEGEDAPTPAPEGRIVNKFDLDVETCFNRYDIVVEPTNEVQEFTTVVDCRRPHDGEVYASHFHEAEAGAPFPGTTEIERWSNVACYGSFTEFVGTDYELSALEIGAIRPIKTNWEDPDARHREVLCYVYAPEAQLSGPMGDSGI